MTLVLVAIVLAIGAGAVFAVSTREPAAAPIGLAVALVAAAVLAETLPSPAVMGVRITAALLAATLIRWAGAGAVRHFSPLGWPSEALFATAGGMAGLGVAIGLASISSGLGGPPLDGPGGPGGSAAGITTMALTIAAGTALMAIGAAPMLHSRAGIRRTIGLVLVAQAVSLLRLGIAGPAPDLEEIARAGLLVACAAAGAALARASTRQPAGEETT